VRPGRIEDPRALDILLAPAPKGETRVVLKDGIHLDNQRYWGDELIEWIGRPVRVKLDVRDAGRIFCFDPAFRSVVPAEAGTQDKSLGSRLHGNDEVVRETAFICEALDLAISGIPLGDLIAAKKRAKKTLMAEVNAMKTLAKQDGAPLAEEIRQIREDQGSIFNLPVGEPFQGNPFVDAAYAAADARRAPGEKIMPAEAEIFSEPKETRRPLRAVGKAEDDEPKRFRNPIEVFTYFRRERQQRGLTPEEEESVRNNAHREDGQGWLSFAAQNWTAWNSKEQEWILRMVPGHLLDDFETEKLEEDIFGPRYGGYG
jgi:hypothetical protein